MPHFVLCRVNPIREAMSPVEMKELWERLRNHIVNNYSSTQKAFLAFDDVRRFIENYLGLILFFHLIFNVSTISGLNSDVK